MARALLLLALCPCAFALDPALDVSQYAHETWKYRDGFAGGAIQDIVQTSDGYLWLGTAFGLRRFDGIKPVAWQPPPEQSGKDQPLPSSNITRLVAARDGTLWIGTSKGLASWKNSKLTQYAELAGLLILSLIEDHEGSIWVGAGGLPDGKFCEIQKGSVRCHPQIAGLGSGAFGLHEDTKENLWVGLVTGVWRWKPGPPQFYPVPGEEAHGIQGIADGKDGALLISTTGAVRRLEEGKSQVAYPYPASMREIHANHLLRDRDGGLWVGTIGRGIVHEHQGRSDVFSQSDGLTGDNVISFFEDREGNIWVATTNGLDRFRELPVVTYSTNQGLSSFLNGSVLAAQDGSIWFPTDDGLEQLKDGHVMVYRDHTASVGAGAREVVVRGLSGHGVGSLFQDSRGRIWVSTLTGIGYLDNKRYTSTPAPGGIVTAITEDAVGNFWIAYQDLGLLKLSPLDEIQRMPWETFGRKDTAYPLLDPVQGGLWLGFRNGGVAYFRDGQTRASYSPADGLAGGRVTQLRFDSDGALWAATEGGLSRLKNGRIATLTSKSGLPCDSVLWTLEDDARSVWLGMPCGLVRVARSELETWAASDRPGHTIRTTVFDSSDGARMLAQVGGFTPHADKSPDGKLWFCIADGIIVVDPRHLPFNKLPPPVHIEAVKVNGKEQATEEGLELSHKSNDLEIDYAALSFTNPDRVMFRYKLEGKDADWQDVGTRRQAYYTGLPPKKYRFRVMASNNDGVWNEAGAAWNFTIVPAYYQTNWFLALCVATGAGCLWLLYQLRVRYLKHEFNVQLEARVGERTRIARDLHDTLLQSFQGVLLKFHALKYLIPTRPAEAEEMLDRVVEQAREAITEGRDAVYGLRSSTLVSNELAQSISVVGDGLCGDHAGADCPEFHVQVEGSSRELVPLVRDETYRIVIEALRNAFKHAHAKRIDVEIHYGRQLRMWIRDDGTGIDQKILGAGGREGHHGLPGMHERAKLAGGKLAVWSRIDGGTEIELTIPGSIAYVKSSGVRAPVGVGKGTG